MQRDWVRTHGTHKDQHLRTNLALASVSVSVLVLLCMMVVVEVGAQGGC